MKNGLYNIASSGKLIYTDLDAEDTGELEGKITTVLGTIDYETAMQEHRKHKVYYKQLNPKPDIGIRSLGLGILLNKAKPDVFVKPLSCVMTRDDRLTGYTMEYIPGKTYNEVIETLKEEENKHVNNIAIGYLALLRKSLSSLHKAGLYHGDIWEKNVMITPSNKIKVIDPWYKEDRFWGGQYDKIAVREMYRDPLKEHKGEYDYNQK